MVSGVMMSQLQMETCDQYKESKLRMIPSPPFTALWVTGRVLDEAKDL